MSEKKKQYGVETRVLKQAVRRNIERFPEDFMFHLTNDECNSLIYNKESQIVIPANYNFGGSSPFAFTEQGIAMLSSVLKSGVVVLMLTLGVRQMRVMMI